MARKYLLLGRKPVLEFPALVGIDVIYIVIS